MEGLIPFLVRAMKKQNIHKHSFRCVSDGSRRSYQLLGSAGDSFNGSSHRRTQSEFQAPIGLQDFQQPQVVDHFIRSRSINTNNNNNNNDAATKGIRQIHQNHAPAPAPAPAAYNYNFDYGDKHASNTINKFHHY